MPSVRVKRDQYTSLQDVFPVDSTGRPRAQSATFPPQRPFSELSQGPSGLSNRPQYVRKRSHTVDGAGAAIESRPPTMRRPPSRVMDHIMSTNRDERRDRSGRSRDQQTSMPSVGEEPGPSADRLDVVSLQGSNENIIYHGDGRRPGRIGSALSFSDEGDEGPHHHDDIVEHLDVIDPAVATVSTLTNAANAIVFPPLSFYSRRPTIMLPDVPRRVAAEGEAEKGQVYEDNLDRHVEDVLSKREKYKRIMRGVWSFLKTPMGVIVGIYGFLVVFWGAGIVFFLGKFVNFHNANTQGFWVEVCQQVETGLFTATSIGLIPFRVLDTWRMTHIWHYKRVTVKRRRLAGLPDLYDWDDLPDPVYDSNYVHVLTEEEQADLHYQQYKFMQSQTWYRPHGTSTHRAFPIYLALWICIMNDLNSFFQCLLSGCMWGLNRFQRPAWTTATTLPAAFVAGILAGVFIWWGGKKTRRHEAVEQRLRAALAMEKPPVDVDGSETSENRETHTSEEQQGSATMTANSTPTLAMQGPPRCKDFADGTDDNEKHLIRQTEDPQPVLSNVDTEDNEKAAIKHRESVNSLGSVAIADQMTVPPPEIAHPESQFR